MLKNCSKMARKKTESKYPIEIVDDVFAEGNATLADTLKAIAGTDAAKVALVADVNVVQRTEGRSTSYRYSRLPFRPAPPPDLPYKNIETIPQKTSRTTAC